MALAKVLERLLEVGITSGGLLRDCFISLMDASIRLKEVQENMEDDEDGEDEDDENSEDDEGTEDEDEVPFLEYFYNIIHGYTCLHICSTSITLKF